MIWEYIILDYSTEIPDIYLFVVSYNLTKEILSNKNAHKFVLVYWIFARMTEKFYYVFKISNIVFRGGRHVGGSLESKRSDFEIYIYIKNYNFNFIVFSITQYIGRDILCLWRFSSFFK